MSFAKKICTKLSDKYSQTLFHSAKKSAATEIATNVLKISSKRPIQTTAEATGDLSGNKIANKKLNTSSQKVPETNSINRLNTTRRLGPLLETGLLLMKKVLKPSAKSVLIPLGLTGTVSATDPAIQNKIHGSGTTTLMISNEKMEDIQKIVKSLKAFGFLIEGVSEIIRNEAEKPKKVEFLACCLVH